MIPLAALAWGWWEAVSVIEFPGLTRLTRPTDDPGLAFSVLGADPGCVNALEQAGGHCQMWLVSSPRSPWSFNLVGDHYADGQAVLSLDIVDPEQLVEWEGVDAVDDSWSGPSGSGEVRHTSPEGRRVCAAPEPRHPACAVR